MIRIGVNAGALRTSWEPAARPGASVIAPSIVCSPAVIVLVLNALQLRTGRAHVVEAARGRLAGASAAGG